MGGLCCPRENCMQENSNSNQMSGAAQESISGGMVGGRTYFANTDENDEVTIDLGELFGVLLHWIWLILLVAVVFGAAAFGYSKFVLPEQFQSTTKLYVLDKKSENSNQSTYTDLQVGSQLTKDYAELITSRTVIEQVIADNNLSEEYDYSTFLDKVEVSTPTDTRIVAITVTDTDPSLAQKMANDIRTEAAELIINTMQIDAVNTYEEANLPTKKSAPSCAKWAGMAALIGAVLTGAIVTLRYLLDDTVKTTEDVDRYLNLSTLAMIPLDENVGSGNREQKKEQKKKGRNKESRRHKEASAYQRPAQVHSNDIRSNHRRTDDRTAPIPREELERELARSAAQEERVSGSRLRSAKQNVQAAEEGDAAAKRRLQGSQPGGVLRSKPQPKPKSPRKAVPQSKMQPQEDLDIDEFLMGDELLEDDL